jgi:hypothetical protein
MSNDEELEALKKKVEELEAKVSPPKEKPFVPAPYQRYDPTAGMSMPPSALQAMAQHPCNQVMRGVIQDRHAPTGRPGMIPSSQQPSDVRGGAGDGKGWAREIPLGPSIHQRYVDAQLDEQDRRDRAELARKLGGGKDG